MKRQNFNPALQRIILWSLSILLVFSLVGFPQNRADQWGSFIVQGQNVEQVVDLVEAQGGQVTSKLEVINGVGALLPRGAVARLMEVSGITEITPNAPVRLADTGGDMPVPDAEYPEVVGADFTWRQGDIGNGITVAVVDTGLANHQGLFKDVDGEPRSRLVGWVDMVDGRPSPHDPNGHGTHVAGIIANSQSSAPGEWNSVSPGVQLASVRVLNEQGYGTYEQVIQGIGWVVQHKDELNIRLMNLSLIAQVQSPYWADPFNQAVMRAWAEGITVVVAAGNSGPGAMSISVPGNNPYVITVGAFTDNFTPMDWSDDYLTPFSAAGPTLDGFVKPDLVAPGAHMVSAMLPSAYISRNHQANRVTAQYFSMAGTSQAAAVASGVAALTLANHPELTPDQVKFRLVLTAFPWIDLESTDALYSMWQQGAGRISAPDAVYTEVTGSANFGMDIEADLAGEAHYQGFSYYDETSGEFRLRGEFSDWTGGYGNWAGGYGNWAGGYGNWAGASGNWAGGYGNWAGGYGNWAGGYGNWAGGYGNWAGGYGNWAGGYGNWAGGYGNWAGSYGDAAFAESFVSWDEYAGNWMDTKLSSGIWVEFEQ